MLLREQDWVKKTLNNKAAVTDYSSITEKTDLTRNCIFCCNDHM